MSSGMVTAFAKKADFNIIKILKSVLSSSKMDRIITTCIYLMDMILE